MLKTVLHLAIFVYTVAALPFAQQSEPPHLPGINGWHVPQPDGSLQWLSKSAGELALASAKLQLACDRSTRLSLNAVNFYLYTLANPEEAQQINATHESIAATNFNATNPTRITVHGWNSNYKDGVNTGVRRALFKRGGDYNMIAVDWQRGRSLEYASSVAALPETGKKVAAWLDFLVQQYNMSLATLELVGFSLGAHVVGFAAKQLSTGKAAKVMGLDPAMPLLSYDKPETRLSSDDALYVESIHTNGGKLGFTQPIGRAAFYPNGGKVQPGCGADLNGSCAHTRAVDYYIETLEQHSFPALRCASYLAANANDCGSTYSSVYMGAEVNAHVAHGVFLVPINEQKPFGLANAQQELEEQPNEKNIYILSIMLAKVKISIKD